MFEDISFNEIKSFYNSKHWDVGVITKEQLLQCGLKPIKQKIHVYGEDFTNQIHYKNLCNTIILIRDGHTWDYTHYEEAVEILKNSTFKDGFYKNWAPVYTNFKEAAIFAGLGVRARNSLIYSYKFGFDCHITAIGFLNKITDFPTNRRINLKMWKRCSNCDDCRKACPPGAIHNEKEPYWIDSALCDNFIGSSNHPTIPSVIKFWHKNLYPEIPKSTIDNIKSPSDLKKYLNFDTLPWDRNGYTFDGHVVRRFGIPQDVPVCRECTSQPRCSKWNGNYPYEDVEKQRQIKIIPIKRGWKIA